MENASPFGNAASIYTTSGAAADFFQTRFRAGMIGERDSMYRPINFLGLLHRHMFLTIYRFCEVLFSVNLPYFNSSVPRQSLPPERNEAERPLQCSTDSGKRHKQNSTPSPPREHASKRTPWRSSPSDPKHLPTCAPLILVDN